MDTVVTQLRVNTKGGLAVHFDKNIKSLKHCGFNEIKMKPADPVVPDPEIYSEPERILYSGLKR